MPNVKIDKLIRSKRKTMTLIIDDKSNIIVRAPLRISQKEINSFVDNNHTWILKKKEQIQNKIKNKKEISYKNGSTFLYNGKEFELVITFDTKYALRFNGINFIMHPNYIGLAQKVFEQWYIRAAYKIISQRAMFYSQKHNLKFNKVRISNAMKRWGSCSSTGNINFSWRLVMAPREVIDYVVVHELAHLIQMNHSKRFWKIVEKILPSYKVYKMWLKNNEHLLDL
ncbi:MAG: SprT family zinc-dependent metalloprotease [FCB group bacterium]|jgi:predicted metal-dependent hydrolase